LNPDYAFAFSLLDCLPDQSLITNEPSHYDFVFSLANCLPYWIYREPNNLPVKTIPSALTFAS
jgi:hypothetical protein